MKRNFKAEVIKIYEELIEYEKKGIFPSLQFMSYFYTVVFNSVPYEEKETKIFYDFHSSLIKRCVDESYNCIKNAKESEYLNLFSKQIKKINYIIFHLSRGFGCLDRCYNESLIVKSFKIYKNKFLIPCKDNLFKTLINYLLYNNNNLEDEENSKKIKKIFNLMNADKISNQEIIKRNNEIIWKNEENNFSENENKILDNWFNNSFLKDFTKK